jgi:hypothetical protein
VKGGGLFKASGMNRRTEKATEREKKIWVEYHMRHKATLHIVDRLKNELENNFPQLTSKEVEVLLQWKGESVSKMGNIANRRILYQQFSEGDAEETSIPAPWTDNNQAELDGRRNVPIDIEDTAYGQYKVQKKKKRDVKQAYQKMSAREKETFNWKMAEIDEVDANEGQSPSPTPTPI